MRNRLFVLALVSIALLVIAVATFASSSLLAPGLHIVATEGVKNNVPVDCVRSSTPTLLSNGLSFQLYFGMNPTVNSFFCLHTFVLNAGTQTIPIGDYGVLLNITDSSGKTVFFSADTPTPPLGASANLAPGQGWEYTAYWNTGQGLGGSGPASVGNYHLAVSLLGPIPGGTAKALVTVSEDISVLPAS